MSEQLIVRLASNEQEPVFWLVWSDSEKEIIASGELPNSAELHTLTERAGQRPVIALVPASDVLLRWVELPAKAGRKVINAIPYMLEEEISGDVEQQFFAMGPRSGSQQAVAIVDKTKMTGWLAQLNEAQIFCEKMLPDALAVPHHEDAWSALELGDQWLVRQDLWQAVQGESNWIWTAMEHSAKPRETALQLASYSPLPVSSLANINIQQQPLDLPLQVLALESISSKINLLQGAYKQTRQRRQEKSKWRMAAILAALALTATLLDKGLTLHQLSTESDALRAQIVEQFKIAMPKATRMGDRRQMRSRVNAELNRLQQGSDGISLLAMLSQLTDAFSQSSVKPQTLRYSRDRNELRMQAVGRSFSSLEQFKQKAESAGFEVEQGAINNNQNGVVSALTVRS